MKNKFIQMAIIFSFLTLSSACTPLMDQMQPAQNIEVFAGEFERIVPIPKQSVMGVDTFIVHFKDGSYKQFKGSKIPEFKPGEKVRIFFDERGRIVRIER